MRFASPRLAALLVAIVAFAAPSAVAEPAQRLKLVVLDDSTGASSAAAHREFARAVSAASAGRLEIETEVDRRPVAVDRFPNPSRAIKQAVADGKLAMGEVHLSALVRDSSIYAVADIPFLAFGFDEADRLMQLARPFIEARLAEDGLALAYMAPEEPLGLFAVEEIETVEQLKGRSTEGDGISARIAELTGVARLIEPAAHVHQYDAHWAKADFATSPAVSSSSSTAAGYAAMRVFHDTRHARGVRAVVMSCALLERLSADDRAALAKAKKAAESFARDEVRQLAEATLRGPGFASIAVVTPRPALMEGLRRIGEQMAREWAVGAGADGFTILRAFQRRSPD